MKMGITYHWYKLRRPQESSSANRAESSWEKLSPNSRERRSRSRSLNIGLMLETAENKIFLTMMWTKSPSRRGRRVHREPISRNRLRNRSTLETWTSCARESKCLQKEWKTQQLLKMRNQERALSRSQNSLCKKGWRRSLNKLMPKKTMNHQQRWSHPGVPHTRWPASLTNTRRRCSPAGGRILRQGRVSRTSSKVQLYNKSHCWAGMAAAHLSKPVLDWLRVWYPCRRASRLWGGRMCSPTPLEIKKAKMAQAGQYHRVWTWLIAQVKAKSQEEIQIRQEYIPRRPGT